jgi:hypothetical protein
LHLQYFRKSSFNAGSCFNFLTVLADLWKGDIEYYYLLSMFIYLISFSGKNNVLLS